MSAEQKKGRKPNYRVFWVKAEKVLVEIGAVWAFKSGKGMSERRYLSPTDPNARIIILPANRDPEGVDPAEFAEQGETAH